MPHTRTDPVRSARGVRALLVALLCLAWTCSSDKQKPVGVVNQAGTGSIAISGEINDASGLPLAGVTVTLAGTSESVQTDPDGQYSFAGLSPGSYSVRPTLNGCSFAPDVVNLNNLAASTVQDFSGSGPACGGAPSVNTGALTGPIVISGRVTDAAGNGVVGVKLALGGNAQAVRFSDLTGGYAFNVAAGSYSLGSSGACAVTPVNVPLNNVTANVAVNFSATAGCTTSTTSNAIATGQVVTLSQGGAPIGQTSVTLDSWPSSADALSGLSAIASRVPGASVQRLTIGGFPAVELRATLHVGAGTLEPTVPGGMNGPAGGLVLLVTTAIAAGATVVEFNSNLPSTASSATVTAFVNAGRDFTANAIPSLHGAPAPTVPTLPPVAPATPPAIPSPLVPGTTSATIGEIEIAAAESSNNVVYASNGTATGNHNGQVMFSTDRGATIQVSKLNLTDAGKKLALAGDPTITVGAPDSSGSQRFYFAELFALSDFTKFKLISLQSTDDKGGTFAQLSDHFAMDCTVAANDCSIPDQPHLAADRFAQSNQGDQLYMAWRHYSGLGFAAGLSCSTDGGSTWSASPDLSTLGGGLYDFPRLAVARDGSVYVAVAIGVGNGSFSIFVQRLARCSDGFGKLLPATVEVSASVKEPPVLAGLDRQPTGNYMLAPDDTDPTGNRVFLVFTDGNTGAGDDDIKVTETIDGGKHWSTPVAVNSASHGGRFFPWICASQGIGYVTWYDRRNSTASRPDVTSYFFASLVDPDNTGTPTVRSDFSVSGTPDFDDRECSSGFDPDFAPAAAARDSQEETLCGIDLPAAPAAQVNAGVCTKGGVSDRNDNAPGSLQLCDFRENNCSDASESCAVGDGAPKYGDYNGAACAHGQLFAAWTSAHQPQGIVCKQAGDACKAAGDCCNDVPCDGGICRPPGILSGGSCVGNGSACTEGTKESNNCCSLNCLAGTCQPGLNVYTSSSIISTEIQCTTVPIPPSIPPLTFPDPFVVDTGLAPYKAIGANYGQPQCPDQLIVDVDLTGALGGKNFSVFGGWSESISTPDACSSLAAQAIVFGLPPGGTVFQIWDEVSSQGVVQGSLCNPTSTHTNPADQGAGGTFVPAGMFNELRIVVRATSGGVQAPVIITGEIIP